MLKRLNVSLFLLCIIAIPQTVLAAECVIVLHGMTRSASAMKRFVGPLQEAGFHVVNVDYPSTRHNIQTLAPLAVRELGIEQCGNATAINFITHSLGGILVRYYLEHNRVEALGRVVMIAPPNQGSEVVDNLRNVWGYYAINGPAGLQLGTDEESIPLQLGPVAFDLGVIAGTKSVNPIFSRFLPTPHDGTVSVQSTKVEGMNDFISFKHTHTFIMKSESVINQAIHFLRNGAFQR